MITRSQNNSVSDAGEETLRLIAALPVPEGLEDRVKSRLEGATRDGRVLLWPSMRAGGDGWKRGKSARAAAAAAIVLVVGGGGWGVYSRVQPAQQPRAIVMPPRVNGAGGFSSAGAIRTPQTLNGPLVTHQATEAPAQTGEEFRGAIGPKKSQPAKAAQPKQPESQSVAR